MVADAAGLGLIGLGGGFQGGAAGPALSGGSPAINDRSAVNIVPPNFNLGNILKDFSGPSANGAGLIPAGIFNQAGGVREGGVAFGANISPFVLLLIAAGAGIVWVATRKSN